ncbi:MAG: type II toxin-antitoxin system HicB family antitoxin [Bacteroidetes bacterium]|nr:MAG: type II toxin-antitoxin system HicB family antitoxin [Bacteroidota bacterium]
MQKYLIIIEKTATGFSAYSPDVQGCVATGKTAEETRQNIQEALQFHLEGLALEGLEMPQAHSQADFVEA